jgi:NAD-dependent SIR2 family protein deacetylase
VGSTPNLDDQKRCTKCGEEKPPEEFSRDRSRKDGRYPQCKACVRRCNKENAGRLAEYNRRWREANRDKQRALDRRYRERKRARTSDAPPEANDG